MFSTKKTKTINHSFSLIEFIILWIYLPLYISIYYDIRIILSRAVRGESLLYVSKGGIVHLYLSQWAIYRIVAIDVRSRREGRDLRKVGFYDPIKNQASSNVPAILYFLEKGAQPTETVHDILKKAEIFKELHINYAKSN